MTYKIPPYFSEKKKQIALLIDPDKHTEDSLSKLLDVAKQAQVNLIFVGGSLLSKPIAPVIAACKAKVQLPVIIFPGNALQVSPDADALLFLTLVSGRNPEFLIGQQVQAAPIIQKYNLATIPTAYILIEGGNVTSVEYISNTKPIPRRKTDIAAATALAAKYMGMQVVYLEAGSGARNSVPQEIIKAVKQTSQLITIVGGGIRNKESARNAFDAGADIVVIGSVAEENSAALLEICSLVK